METLLDRLKYIINETTDGKHTLFAKVVGIPTSTFQNIISGQFPKAEHLILISEKCGVSIDWLLLGKGDPYLSVTGKREVGDEKGLPLPEGLSKGLKPGQSDMLGQFMDKSYARDISLSLAELERLNPEALKRVGSYISGLLDGIRMTLPNHQHYAGPDRRVAERRTKNVSKNSENGKDRRLGKDRRAGVIR